MHKRALIIYEASTRDIYYIGNILPLGPLYIKSYLNAKGIKVDFVDRNVERNRKINAYSYDAIGFSTTINNIENTLKTIKTVKLHNPGVEIVIGGPLANAFPRELMQLPEVDVVFAGEGEESFYEYVTGVDKNRIKGLYFKIDGTVVFTGEREWNKNLDSLPFPALDKVTIKKYGILFSRRLPVSSIITSRGCPYRCAFCFHNMGNVWRGRSAENVVDEIEWQVNCIGVKEIIIQDDNFSFNLNRAKEIFDTICSRKIKVKIQFGNGVRADKVDMDFFKKMRLAGGWVVNVAPEVGNNETFLRFNKGFQLSDVERAVRMAKECGVLTEAFFLVGFPGETIDDLKKTLEFASKLKTDFIGFSRFIPFPKTEFYDAHRNAQPVKELLRDRVFYPEEMLEKAEGQKDKLLTSFYRRYYLNPKRLLTFASLFFGKSLNPPIMGKFIHNLNKRVVRLFLYKGNYGKR